MSTTNVRTLAALLAMTAGCTLVYSDEVYGNKKPKKQCSTASDCEKLAKEGDTNKYVCEQSLCQIAECLANTDCASMMCDTTSHTCVQIEAGVDAPSKPCKLDKDCDVENGELCSEKDGHCYSKWGCLDLPSDWLDSENIATDFTYKAVMRSLNGPDTPELLGDLTVTACNASDITCARPFVSPEQVKVEGDKHITVPFKGVKNGFIGTIRVDAALPGEVDAGMGNGVLPGVFQFTGDNPLVNNTIAQNRAILIPYGIAKALAGSAGTVDVTMVSSAVFLLYDCGGNHAGDMSIDIPGNDKYQFIPLSDEMTPNIGGDRTNRAFGAAFVAAIPSGFQKFVITDRSLKKARIITDAFTFNVAKEAINYVQYYPRYSALKKWMDYAAKHPDRIP